MFKIIREQFGISQKDLAEKLSISQAAVSQIESGEIEPSFSTLQRLYFLYGSDALIRVIAQGKNNIVK